MHYIVLALISLLIASFSTEAAGLNPITSDIPLPQVSEETTAIDNLIEVTEKNLADQKQLRGQIQDFQILRKRFVKNKNDLDAAYDMVQSARNILEKIKESHLTHVFSPDFISELTFFSQIANKRGIPAA